MAGQAEIQKMNGRQHWPMGRECHQHILAYIGCKFKAYLCQNNWQKNLNTSMAWVDGQKS